MQKLLILTCLGLSYFGILSVSVLAAPSDVAPSAGQTNNVNSAEFIVNIGQMDPLRGAHEVDGTVSGVKAFSYVLGKITNILLFMMPILAGISLLIAGYIYIFSAGDSEKATKAKTIIKWNIIAIFVGFLSYGIVSIVASFFNP